MPPPLRRKLRAPQEDGAALFDPPLAEAPALVVANQAALADFDRLTDFPANYRIEARKRMLVGLAHNEGQNPESIAENQPLIMSGHQPELFHPGVWLKNFAISSIARAVSGKAIHLVIDNDTIRSATMNVPTGTRNVPRVEPVAFDAAGEAIPWQDRQILDPTIFENFTEQVRRRLEAPIGGQLRMQRLILDRLWPYARDAWRHIREEHRKRLIDLAERVGLSSNETTWAAEKLPAITILYDCLTKARNRVEQDFGVVTSELPLSWWGFGDQFRTFAQAIFARHREFHHVHNRVLAEYRKLNHIRSDVRPVADLAQEGDWFEMPFWIWTAHNPERRRVFARQIGTSWEITDHAGIVLGPSVKDWMGIDDLHKGYEFCHIRFRPRALITTMYARLVLSDLFIHGIGGAKYDEVTDEIIRRFFGIEPPKYVTATATFRLPIDRPQVTVEDVRECARRLRDVRYRPESFLNGPLLANEPEMRDKLASLAAEKKEYVARHALRRGGEEVYRGLDKLNRAMHELLAPVEENLRREQAQLADDLKAAQVLGSREFSFVLFPEEYLVPRLLELSRLSA